MMPTLPDEMVEAIEASNAAERICAYPFDDTGSARALLDHHGPDLLAVEGSRDEWAVWDGVRWAFYPSNQLTREFEAAVTRPLKLAVATDPENQDLARWAKACGRFQQMVTGIRHAHSLARDPSSPRTVNRLDFDQDPELLGVVNGVLDLSGPEPVLRPRSSDLLVTKSTRCEWDPDATHPALDEYLDRFLPEPDMREFVQRVLGYAALRAGNPERLMVWLRGPTSTGKSALVDWIHATLGNQYAKVGTTTVFLEQRQAGPSHDLAEAIDKRFLSMSELGTSTRLHASQVKRLTGDPVTSRKNYGTESKDRKPAFTPVVTTNSVPQVDQPDDALHRRLLVIPFLHATDRDEPDRRQDENPETWPAVLAWLAEGYRRFKERGLGPETWPGAVREETERTFHEMHPGAPFWAECIEEVEGERIRNTLLTEAFLKWQIETGIPQEIRLSRSQFQTFVREQKGYTPASRKERVPGQNKRVAKTFYIGVRLREGSDDQE